jgi:hypothetical protein
MDFITGLLRSEGKDVLLVVVDKLKLITRSETNRKAETAMTREISATQHPLYLHHGRRQELASFLYVGVLAWGDLVVLSLVS